MAARLDRFPADPFGRQCREVALLLAAGSDIPVIKTSIGSFDTHVRQAPTHERLLAQLAGGLGELRRFAREDGSWSEVLVLTYSEFGRRAAENRAAGTDHGAAAPHFVLGGRVRGGLIGHSPDLERLEDGDVRATTDFRRLLATVAKRWWPAPAGAATHDEWAPLGIL